MAEISDQVLTRMNFRGDRGDFDLSSVWSDPNERQDN